jgi:RNA-binding protein
MTLTSKQRKHLEALAHDLDPLVRIGKNGMIPEVTKTVDENLAAHELIKVKILENADLEKDDAAEELVKATNAVLVRTIGRIIILYRPAKDPKKRRIDLSPEGLQKAAADDDEPAAVVRKPVKKQVRRSGMKKKTGKPASGKKPFPARKPAK